MNEYDSMYYIQCFLYKYVQLLKLYGVTISREPGCRVNRSHSIKIKRLWSVITNVSTDKYNRLYSLLNALSYQ